MSGKAKGVTVKVKVKAKGKSLPDAANKLQGASIPLPAVNLQRFAQGPPPAKGGRNAR